MLTARHLAPAWSARRKDIDYREARGIDRVLAIADRVKYLGVDGLKYNTIQDLSEAIGPPLESLCVDCALG